MARNGKKAGTRAQKRWQTVKNGGWYKLRKASKRADRLNREAMENRLRREAQERAR